MPMEAAHLRFVLSDRDRLFDHGQNLVRHRRDVALAAHLLQNQRELVAAQPAQHIPFAQLHRHAPAELHQQRVAGVVTEALVHLTEGGEVDQQHRAGAARLHRGEQRALELADEVVAVGQLGERIEVRQLLDAPLRLAALHELAPQGGLALADALEQRVDVGGERADLVVRLGRCAQLEALLRDRLPDQSRQRRHRPENGGVQQHDAAERDEQRHHGDQSHLHGEASQLVAERQQIGGDDERADGAACRF